LAVAVAVTHTAAFAGDPQKAEQLFHEGRDAVARGEYAVGCRKFVESESAEPRVGTLINLARCEESSGHSAKARQYWQQATDLARALGDPRADFTSQELARIDGSVPRLTIRLHGGAPPDSDVRRDGVEFGHASLGVALPLERGSHTIEVSAPGHEPRRFVVQLDEGQSLDVVVAPGPLVEEARLHADDGDEAALAHPNGSGPGVLRPVAYVAAGLGVVALGVGAAYGVSALSSASAAAGHCDGAYCDAPGTAARRDEASSANAATLAFASGIALVTAGAALRVLTPSADEAPRVRRNLAYVVGALGLVSTVTGALLGVHAIAANDEAGDGCNAANVCDHQGAAARRDAIDAGNTSTTLLVAGGALLAGGAVLWATAPRAESTPATSLVLMPSTGGAAVGVTGRW
jgi:hypothetical protein